jgi:hypothetical protein
MKPEIVLKPEFVEFIPEQLEERTLYVAAKYRTVVHLCCCGCGRKVVTPLSPTAWKLTFDGVHITLHPSVGNWNLPCKSHYWIERNQVKWAGRWTPGQIEAGRAAEERARAEYYGEDLPQTEPKPAAPVPTAGNPGEVQPQEGRLRRLWRRLFG